MNDISASPEIARVMQLLSRLPGLGPRSARRVTLHLLKNRQTTLEPLARALAAAAEAVRTCPECGNLDTQTPCAVCRDARRQREVICVVADVADLWALERAGVYRGLYHVLGGLLSPLEGVRPEDLDIDALVRRAAAPEVNEVILALSATVEGQATAHYIADALAEAAADVRVTRLAHGVPVGGELEYLDEGTLAAALRARR
ncbi:MAG TPA: recombination protein RecR [Thermopetrobacter sp.]|nr:recombination protein RecR [Thermopetrobacter sp.]